MGAATELGLPTALAITADNHAEMRGLQWGRHVDWSGFQTVVACGPRLLTNGRVTLDPAGQRFRDPHVLGVGARTAVGLTDSNLLLVSCVKEAVSLRRLAEVMRALGCRDAMNLDGGAALCLYYQGRLIIPRGRNLTNSLVMYDNASPPVGAGFWTGGGRADTGGRRVR
ncbi:MAG: phosphodiester glycosidase family protein [Armatimonadota bacterium]